LGQIGDKRATAALVTTLHDPHPLVRRSAVSALGDLDDRTAVEPLVALLTDMMCNDVAAESLQKLAWQPRSMEERVHYLVALEDPAILEDENWPDVRTVLMRDAHSKNEQRSQYGLFTLTGISKDRSILPALAYLIRHRGTITIVNEYLYSEETQLRDAARDWAKAHGYSLDGTPAGTPSTENGP
jgi:hypothetical protein